MENNIMKYWESVPRKARGWYREFIKSERFKELSEEQRIYAENVIMVFAETVYHFEFETPQQWDDHGLRCCCPGIFSIRPINDIRFIRAITPVLNSFFEFLYEKGYNEDGKELAEIVRKLEPEILRKFEYRKKYLTQGLG